MKYKPGINLPDSDRIVLVSINCFNAEYVYHGMTISEKERKASLQKRYHESHPLFFAEKVVSDGFNPIAMARYKKEKDVFGIMHLEISQDQGYGEHEGDFSADVMICELSAGDYFVEKWCEVPEILKSAA